MDLVNFGAGIAVTVVGGLVLFLLTTFVFNRNSIWWSPDLPSTSGIRNFLFDKTDGERTRAEFSQASALLKVKTWSQVREVTLHIKGEGVNVTVYPKTPFDLTSDGDRAKVIFRSLGPGQYAVHAYSFLPSRTFLEFEGVDANNAVAIKRREQDRAFNSISWELIFYRIIGLSMTTTLLVRLVTQGDL